MSGKDIKKLLNELVDFGKVNELPQVGAIALLAINEIEKLEAAARRVEPLRPLPVSVNGKKYYTGRCPGCDAYVISTQSFCDRCGQALDWEGGSDDQG